MKEKLNSIAENIYQASICDYQIYMVDNELTTKHYNLMVFIEMHSRDFQKIIARGLEELFKGEYGKCRYHIITEGRKLFAPTSFDKLVAEVFIQIIVEKTNKLIPNLQNYLKEVSNEVYS